MKVLIITYYWPPAGGSGVQRWLFFVKYLRKYGIEPIVYTAGDAAYPVIDKSLEKHVPEGIEVIHGRIWEPARLLRKSNKDLSAGFLHDKPGWKHKFLHYIRANFFVPDARMFWIKPSVRFLMEYLKNNPVDWIISTGPPHSTHLIARKLKRRTGIPWLADFRDPWTDIDFFHKLPLTPVNYARHRRMESSVLTLANVLTVVSGEMKRRYLPYNPNTLLIPNGFDGDIKKPEVFIGSEFVLTHIGMMNADRNHESFWKSIRKLLDEIPLFSVHLKIKLIGKIAPEVKRSIRRYNLTKYTEIIPYVPYEEMESVYASSAVLLLFINRVPGAKGIVTGKIFEYLRSGKPVLAIAPEDGDLSRIIKETRAGDVTGFKDEEKITGILRKFYELYRKKMLKAETTGIEIYSRKHLTGELAKLLKKQ